MLSWSFSLISRIVGNEPLMYAALWVASLNMLIQIFFDMAFGAKGVPRLGAYRK